MLVSILAGFQVDLFPMLPSLLKMQMEGNKNWYWEGDLKCWLSLTWGLFENSWGRHWECIWIMNMKGNLSLCRAVNESLNMKLWLYIAYCSF